MSDYARLKPRKWHALMNLRNRFRDGWVFRGQVGDDPLRTSLDRVLLAYDIPDNEVPGIERQAIRDFRRRYHGDDEVLVQSDSLYCLALSRHSEPS